MHIQTMATIVHGGELVAWTNNQTEHGSPNYLRSLVA